MRQGRERVFFVGTPAIVFRERVKNNKRLFTSVRTQRQSWDWNRVLTLQLRPRREAPVRVVITPVILFFFRNRVYEDEGDDFP